MMALKQRRDIFRGLRNSSGMQQKFSISPSQCTRNHSPARSSFSLTTLYCLLCGRTLPAERPTQIQSQAHWKLQAQTLPYAWVHLSQQIQDCPSCLAGTGCKWLSVPAETQRTWPSPPHPAQELYLLIPSKTNVA